jgi:hypothetical protein
MAKGMLAGPRADLAAARADPAFADAQTARSMKLRTTFRSHLSAGDTIMVR